MAFCSLQDTFIDHLKFEKLAKVVKGGRPDLDDNICILVSQGVVTRFWSWCLRHHPDGSISLSDKEEAERATRWPLTSIGLIEAMHQCGLLDNDGNGSYEIHNLTVHGGTYAESRKRAERRKRNKEALVLSADVRESPRTSEPLYSTLLSSTSSKLVDSVNTSNAYTSNREVEASNPPVSSADLGLDGAVQQVFCHWKSHHPRCRLQKLPVTDEAHVLVRQALKAGFSIEDCKKAVDGFHNSAFHQGANEDNQKYNTMAIIFANVSRVQKGIDMAHSSLESSMLGKDGVAKAVKLQKWINEGSTKLLEDK